ncbi:Disintegrin and metalloproteinase domain-containing protein 12 [Armadillidium nasatum]|uniref:Disintegrin and metalloproteinase domain-containing protein 12 n=1 Tax=Armadillidium nasatum TaxID=96803 RepID=A0A5N5SSQ1_9CRUS|nr:Disintegrin and metalloproteinase domain-containing protein 12 [Armadillidium nasatum]
MAKKIILNLSYIYCQGGHFSKRRINRNYSALAESHVNHLTLGLNLGERDILIDLYLNRNLLSENYFEKSINKKMKSSAMCHYQGSIRDVPGSWAAVSTCKGIRGVVFDGEDTHYLEPIPGYKRDTTENSIRGPFNANSLSRYVELVLVADKTEFEKHDSDENKIYERCKDIANIVNALYQPLNIFIALVGVEVWKDEDPVEISTDGDKTLTNFLNYRKVRLIPEHPNDNAQLLTGKVFDSGVVGKALKGPICTYQYSGGVNMDHSDSVGLVATTVAHEMGHNFGMEHDTEEDCKCPDKRCIMAPSSGSTKSPSHWSSCSHEYLAISFERSMDYCLRNKPTSLFDSPVCGNGFVEAGEQCDCGLEEHCNNPCCNSSTCMLFSNATCATGHCCDLQTCRPRPAGMECRAALHECDLPEYCSGDSEYCPDNFYKEDGYPCLGGQAYCYEGMCRTHEHQCRLLWGPTGKNSHDKCYNLNKEGNTHGNCGYNWANNTYKRCQSSDIKCGMMHCKHFNERLEFGMESVSKVSHRFIADKQQGVIPCRVAQVDLGLDMVDPGLAPDGAKCGYNKMCVGQHCLEVASLRKQVCNCNGRGVCNNMGNCHCNLGFAWPDCKYPGLGGSSDSGPASNPNATNKFVVGMFIFFLGIVPLTVLLFCFVYYVRGNFKFWLAQKGRPVNSRLSGLEHHLGSALRVEVVTKNRGNTAVDGTVSDVRSPSPPSSQGSKSNSPLLNGHANGASGNFSKFFGKHEGFTLSPIKEKPKGGELTQGTEPISPHLVDISSAATITSPSVTNSISKIKPNSQNSRPLVIGVKPQVDISGPSLQTSTNPAVQAPTPLQSTTTPVRQAPQRPKSVPDASTLILENMPSANAKQKDQTKSSTVSRIASFLSKKEKIENATVGETTQCNTLPRKAAKINRESLLQLEISHPMQLQATELPSNLVPVRPAPDPPMPSNIKPSQIKENQEKNSIAKVSWTSNIESNIENSNKEFPRIGSVREHSVTVRPPIPKFGSMRAPRPKSLPPPRPSQPPPRPPLPMIPGTPETEYFYDDCITVQVSAPLAHEEDGTSPSQEGIYATIDEESPNSSSPSHDSLENKKDKKNIFSMLYAKTKKKKNNEVTEPLYCNIDNGCSAEKDDNLNREDSSHSPSPVIVDRVSCGSTDDGGLLSEIVTELVTREPQYMNTLSKKSNKDNGSPHKENKKDTSTVSPEKINSRKNSINSSVSLSPKANDESPKTEKPKPYIPYSSLKPRGVFTFFNKSNSEEEKQEPKLNTSPIENSKTLETTPLPNKESKEVAYVIKPEYLKSSMAASLAGVKAASAEAKSSVHSENHSPSNPKNEKESTVEPQDLIKNPVSSAIVKTQNTVTESATQNATRSRPVFPPDKVLHSSDKSLPKQGASSVKKPLGSINEQKPSGAPKNKISSTSSTSSQNFQGKSSTSSTGSQNFQGKSSTSSAAKSSNKKL